MAPGEQHIADEKLVVYYQETRDKLAVGELFKRHSLMCFAVCNKYLKDEEAAKDATMSIFEKLFTDLEHHPVQNFKSWFHTVCKNYCLMQLRKPQLMERMDDMEEKSDTLFMEFDGLLHHEDKEQKLLLLEEAMDGLNEKQKECVSLFYLEQKSYKEICDQTGYSSNEVKSHIQNAKRNLKIMLGHKGIAFSLLVMAWIQHNA